MLGALGLPRVTGKLGLRGLRAGWGEAVMDRVFRISFGFRVGQHNAGNVQFLFFSGVQTEHWAIILSDLPKS